MATPFAITGIDVLTGEADGVLHRDWTVVVDGGGTIAAAGPSASTRPDPQLPAVDGTGKVLIPGLINAHAHLFADGRPLAAVYTHPRLTGITTRVMHTPLGRRILRRRVLENATTQLHSGVTTLRTVGDVDLEVVDLARRIDAGAVPGPRILPSGPLLAITGGHGAPQIARTGDDPAVVRAHARRNLRQGALALKIAATGGVTDAPRAGYAGIPEMAEESMRAICEEAHAAGVLVAAHAQGAEGVLAALRAGVDTIEHGSELSPEIIELFLDNPRSLRGWSALVPTLLSCVPLAELSPRETGLGPVVQANARLVLDRMLAAIRGATEHGIVLGIGTDSGVSYVTHGDYWREMDLHRRLTGADPSAILRAATATNARILGIEGVTGTVAPGRSADLVVLDGDPRESFRHLAAPWMVIARGERIVHPEPRPIPAVERQLDALWAR